MRFELHCHSTYSDGKSPPREIVEYARKIGLNGIAITDHDEIRGSLEALQYASKDFTVIPGMEVSSAQGHILALNVRELVPRDMSAEKTVERIHALGGIAIAAHPYDRWRRGVGDLILTVPFDAVEVLNGHTFGNVKNPEDMRMRSKLPAVGGSDAHTKGEIGLVWVECEGDIIEAIKSGKAWVRSKPLPQLLLNHGVGMVKRKSSKLLRKVIGK